MQRTVLIILTLLHHRKSHLSVKLSGFGDFCWKNFYFSFGKVWWFWSFLFLFTMVRRCWVSEISTFENFRKIFFFFCLLWRRKISWSFWFFCRGVENAYFPRYGRLKVPNEKIFYRRIGRRKSCWWFWFLCTRVKNADFSRYRPSSAAFEKFTILSDVISIVPVGENVDNELWIMCGKIQHKWSGQSS